MKSQHIKMYESGASIIRDKIRTLMELKILYKLYFILMPILQINYCGQSPL